MKQVDQSRRRLLRNVAMGVALVPLASLRQARAAGAPLVTTDDPTAKTLKYVSDARKSPDAKPGSPAGTERAADHVRRRQG